MLHVRSTKLTQAVTGSRMGRCCSTRRFSVKAFVNASDECHRRRGGSAEHPFNSKRKELLTLAIETSCDDTSVAVLKVSANVRDNLFRTDVLFHETITAASDGYDGIHPLVALDSHQRALGSLVQKARKNLQSSSVPMELRLYGPGPRHYPVEKVRNEHPNLPDFISVTRGPGMRSNLSVGLDTAKGLATAWDIPLVGVHHMQAHALTPRLCHTLQSSTIPGQVLHNMNERFFRADSKIPWRPQSLKPQFPFLTLLARGGHTMLIDSTSLTEHKILARTSDVALGDCIDKAARAILLESETTVPYGRALEAFAFPSGDYDYTPPRTRSMELLPRMTRWGWSLSPPLSKDKGLDKSTTRMIYSFAGLYTTVQRLMSTRLQGGESGAVAVQPRMDNSATGEDSSDQGLLPKVAEDEGSNVVIPGPRDMPLDERREMAREFLRVAFEHVASRILLHLTSLPPEKAAAIQTLVLSGGVAANQFLRHVLRTTLVSRGFGHIELSCPPPALCTDNALMIAWAGMEMYINGYASDLSIRPIRDWSMDSSSPGDGILGVDGWTKLPTPIWHRVVVD